MNIFQALILGILQGLTEFLPISSSGHLIILPDLLDWVGQPLAFDTTLHLGTALALVVYFFKDLVNIGLGFIKDVLKHEDNFKKYSKDGKMGLYILVGSIPAIIIGYRFEHFIETQFRNIFSVSIFLLLGTLLMLIAEMVRDRIKDSEIDLKKSLYIGLFQVLALGSGFSRSGSTISGGMIFGLKREEAARFSFLLSVPIVIGAGLFKLKGFELGEGISFQALASGFLSSFIVGMLAIKFLLKFLRTNKLYLFILYRIILLVLLIFIPML